MLEAVNKAVADIEYLLATCDYNAEVDARLHAIVAELKDAGPPKRRTKIELAD